MKDFNWTPGIGDPTFAGWLTVISYLVTAVACWRVAGRLRDAAGSSRAEVFVWRAIAVLFLALGVNKQLDLQSAFTEIGRTVALAQGWYERRETVQLYFIVVVAAVCLLVAATLVMLIRNAPAATWLAVLGTAVVLTFVAVRAASFHHVDRFIGTTVLGLRWNWILEIGGILLVLIAGWRRT
jgi:hypothetical protein